MITSRLPKKTVCFLLVTAAFLAAHLHFLLLPGIFNAWNAQTTDQLFLMRNNWPRFSPVYNPVVAHVDLTNSTIRRLATPYLSRRQFARAVDNLAAMKVSVQLWDFIFAAPDTPAHDSAFIEAVRKAGHVYFGMALELSHQPRAPPDPQPLAGVRIWRGIAAGSVDRIPVGLAPFSTFDELAAASRGVGSLSVNFDPDGVLRRVPLVIRRGGGFIPVLSLQAACDYLGVPPERIKLVPGKHLTLKGARRPGTQQAVDIEIPIDEQGNMIVNYAGPWERMDHYNIADIMAASHDRDELEMWATEMRGKIVVVSDLTTGSADIGTVPGDTAFPLGGVHANIINSILTGAFVREVPPGVMLAIEAFLMLLVWGLAIRLSSFLFLLGASLLGLVYIGAGTTGFFYGGLLLNMVRPLLMLFFAIMAILVYRYVDAEREKLEGLRQRDDIRTTFGRYLSNEVVEALLASPEGLHMGGEIRRVTFLVADLRGFTALSGALSPASVIEILNRFLGTMVDVVARHQGTVDEIQGDGLLIFFGAPLSVGEDEARAVACAVDMQNALKRLNADQVKRGQPELSMGIGIHSGDVVVGNIGSEKRAKYGAVGSAINTAFRIESHTVPGQILVSAATFEAVRDQVQTGGTVDVHFKGLREPVKLYDIIGIQNRALIPPEPGDDKEVVLSVPLPVVCHFLEGKEISRQTAGGELRTTGRQGGRILLAAPVPVHTNLLVRCRPDTADKLEMYAKVTAAEDAGDAEGRFAVQVHYTWVSGAARTMLAELMEGDRPDENT